MQYMPCSSQIIGEMLPETHTVKKFVFSQNYESFSNDIYIYIYIYIYILLMRVDIGHRKTFYLWQYTHHSRYY